MNLFGPNLVQFNIDIPLKSIKILLQVINTKESKNGNVKIYSGN